MTTVLELNKLSIGKELDHAPAIGNRYQAVSSSMQDQNLCNTGTGPQ